MAERGAYTFCPRCGAQLGNDMHYCSTCGAVIRGSDKSEEKKGTRKKALVITAIVLAVVAWGMASFLITRMLAGAEEKTGVQNTEPAKIELNQSGGSERDSNEIHYQQALVCIEAGNYLDALSELDKIDSGYKKYDEVLTARETASDAYREEMFTAADEYVKAGDYDSAVGVLSMLEKTLGPDGGTEEKILWVSKAEVNAAIVDCEKSGDLAGAITCIKDKLDDIGNDADILAKLSTLENEYRAQTITQAEKAFSSENYEKAVEIINAALDVMPDDGELQRLKEEYLTGCPASLSDLECLKSGYFFISGEYTGESLTDNEYELEQIANVTDNRGNTYSTALYGGSIKTNNYYWWSQYDVSDYKTFTGRFVLSAESGAAEEWPYPRIIIEGDGKQLAAYAMDWGSDPIDISLDISRFDVLTVYLYGPEIGNSVNRFAYLVNAYVKN